MGSDLTLGFLGAGKMATALASGCVRSGLIHPPDLVACDIAPKALEGFVRATGGRAAGSNLEVIKAARVLVVAVKPDQVSGLLEEIRGDFTSNHLLISIAAGVPIGKLETGLGGTPRVVRAMPNTPALVGQSATGYALGQWARSEDAATTQSVFGAIGVAYALKESLLDAVTGLSGSGPAYGFLMIEALSDGGVAAGLPREVATRLAAQTLLGAARMVLETNQHPAELKDMVTSPGGTTIEGIHQLESGGVRAALINAVRAAADKAAKLGRGNPS